MLTELGGTNFSWLKQQHQGKVRDIYEYKDFLILIASDRQSAFDISWCLIPFKGQVLTQISLWWFERVKDLIPNHIISSPDPNVLIVKKLKMFPIEVVVRDYLTGSTETSIWINYKNGQRDFCGNILPDGMVKNTRLSKTIITPTTKGEHDRPISPQELIDTGVVSSQQWQTISAAALALFARGQEIAKANGLILVDTKYEFGIDITGQITLGDEVHTPDSSRYWIADSYQDRFKSGLEPESLDKEFFRQWLVQNGFDIREGTNGKRPEISSETIANLSQKYIELYQKITGQPFIAEKATINVAARIENNLKNFLNLSSG
jgi:fusion protein PurCD